MSIDDQIAAVRSSKLSDEDKARIERLLIMLTKRPHEMTGGERQAARIAAGLSLGQAAKLLGVTTTELAAAERDVIERIDFSPQRQLTLWRAMERVYGLGDNTK